MPLPLCVHRVGPAYSITRLLVLENSRLLAFPLKFNLSQLKHCGSFHEGTDALEKSCWGGVFPGWELCFNVEATTHVPKNENRLDGNGVIP